jgi:glycine betaine/choline ABC-type transport system substrate-binding protein
VREGWAAVASPTLAARLAAPSLSGLSEIVRASSETIRFAATEEFGREAFAQFLETYGFDAVTAGVTWTTTVGEAEAMVKFGAADVALVGNLEETLTLSGYPSLSDDLGVLASSPIDMVVVEELLERHSGIEAVLSALVARLTTEILHDLSSRVRLLGETPEDVAREFLSAASLHE